MAMVLEGAPDAGRGVPGEEHWHGAAPNHFMTHIAMWEVDDQDNSATWGAHVSDEEYGAPPRRSTGEEA